MSDQEPNYNSIWDLKGSPINKPEPDKGPVCVCDICGQDHAEIQHCAFKGLIADKEQTIRILEQGTRNLAEERDALQRELAEAMKEITRLKSATGHDGNGNLIRTEFV